MEAVVKKIWKKGFIQRCSCMIFVTVGTSKFGFDRLLKKIDFLIKEKKIKEHVVMQIGNSSYEPKNAEWFRFESYEKMKDLIKKSRIIIMHAGVGSILTAMIMKKNLIIVPRMKKFNEHVDDHQVEFSKYLIKEYNITVVFDVEDLEYYLTKKSQLKIKSKKNELVNFIKLKLNFWENKLNF